MLQDVDEESWFVLRNIDRIGVGFPHAFDEHVCVKSLSRIIYINMFMFILILMFFFFLEKRLVVKYMYNIFITFFIAWNAKLQDTTIKKTIYCHECCTYNSVPNTRACVLFINTSQYVLNNFLIFYSQQIKQR